MDYYGTLRNDYIHKEMYPSDHRVDYFPKGPFTGSVVKITPKPNCVPRFVSKIEGNAVEEGEKVFFEGIVDAQPMPIFSWYFNDEPIEPGRPGWEDTEVHESRKMSTLILTYVREHHMGKYTLVAQNRMGHAACSCDLIVRKKQFPPVFWQRLYNYEATSGSKLIAEVEVGGWPIPHLVWYKDDEPVKTALHTENYNGFPNKYVPERRVEVRQLDPIRHCIIFHRISESDAGLYTVVATNPLGEAVCQANFVVEPGEGGAAGLYLPEKWRRGKRTTWADEDRRAKKFVGVAEPELTDEDIAEMTSRVSGVPLPRAIEYLASLPDYYPTPIEGLVKMNFQPGLGGPDGDGAGRREGKKGGKPSKPSKFVPGKIQHSGFVSDDVGRFLPIWFNDRDPNARDPNQMAYSSFRYDYPEPRPRPERPKSPPCPHVWETHETIDTLYKLLDTVGCRKQEESIKAKQVQKFSYLNPNKSVPPTKDQTDSKKKVAKVEASEANTGLSQIHLDSQQQYEEMQHAAELREIEAQMAEAPPALPPKTKIMFSPSRHLFSPTDSIDSNDAASVQTVEYIPVKEKVKMIAQQQEEIFRKEEMKRHNGQSYEVTPPAGGVRILPPSPVTVRRAEDFNVKSMTSHSHVTQASQQSRVERHANEQFGRFVAESKQEENVSEAEESEIQSSQLDEEVMYVTQVSSQQSQTMSQSLLTTTMAQQGGTFSTNKKDMIMIPRLEDKYGVESHLEEISSTIDSEESFTSSQTTGRSTMTATLSSASAASTSTTIKSEHSSKAESLSTMRQSIASQESVKSMQDSSYSTGSYSSSAVRQQPQPTATPTPHSVTFKDVDTEVEAISSNRNATQNVLMASQRGRITEKSSTEEQSSWASRDPFPRSSPSICASPRVGRKPRVDASPRRQESESPKYRTPPSTPFQPGFYRKPAEDEPRSNPFPLPSPSPRRPRQPRTRPRDEGSDSEDEV